MRCCVWPWLGATLLAASVGNPGFIWAGGAGAMPLRPPGGVEPPPASPRSGRAAGAWECRAHLQRCQI